MFAFRLAHSAAVRINSRGIRFIPVSHTLHLARQNGAADSISLQEFISGLILPAACCCCLLDFEGCAGPVCVCTQERLVFVLCADWFLV